MGLTVLHFRICIGDRSAPSAMGWRAAIVLTFDRRPVFIRRRLGVACNLGVDGMDRTPF